MKNIRLLILSFAIFAISSLFGQATESFDSFSGGGVVSSGSFTGENNVVWSYTNCTGDESRQVSYTTKNTTKNFASVAYQFSNQGCVVSQTDQFVAAPNAALNGGVAPPLEWHLAASYGKSDKCRILTLIKLTPTGGTVEVPTQLSDGSFRWGDWDIKAQLDEKSIASLEVRSATKNVVFSDGTTPLINGQPYVRTQPNSSLLYDDIAGVKKVVEIVDRPAQATR